MTIDNELIDNLLKNYKKPEDLIGENGLLKQLTKQLVDSLVSEHLRPSSKSCRCALKKTARHQCVPC